VLTLLRRTRIPRKHGKPEQSGHMNPDSDIRQV
jgi:hypothetical protein